MLHILLFIFKIIGIVLLAILVLALLLLFLPVSYKVKGKFDQKQRYIKLRGGWMFHIIHFYFTYDEEIDYGIRIFGIKIRSKEEEQKEIDYLMDEKPHDSDKQREDISKIEEVTKKDKNNEPDEDKKIQPKEKLEKIRNILFQCITLFVRIVTRIKIIIKNIREKFYSFQEVILFLKSEDTKVAYNYVKEKTIKSIKHMRPRKIRGQVEFGFESPDKTGQTLGMIGMISAAANINLKHFKMIPDFENKKLDGVFYAKGHFLMGIVGFYILQMYMKEEVKDILDKL